MAERKPLLPQRHDHDLFFCDVFDAIPKNDVASMEHPIFSLSTKPDMAIRSYVHNNVRIEVSPSKKGLATMHDKDFLIYFMSQLMHKLNDGLPVSRELYVTAYDMLRATNRRVDGKAYEGLIDALNRLSGTRVQTNIVTNDELIDSEFGLIDSWRVMRTRSNGRMESVKVTLSEWLFNAVKAKEVLTIHSDFYRLRKPLEKRLYELARKHCGQQSQWKIGMELLWKKTGSRSPLAKFRFLVREIVKTDEKTDYFLDFRVREEDNLVTFLSKRSDPVPDFVEMGDYPRLKTSTFEYAKSILPGHDIYTIQAEWLEHWEATGRPLLDSADAAFIGFVKGKAKSLINDFVTDISKINKY